MIKLAAIFPGHLNLNGDLGNLLVLQRRLEWSGQPVEVSSGNDLPAVRPDFLVIGHGSTAAWRQIYSRFAQMVPTISSWLEQGTVVLAVSSGYAALHGLLANLPDSVERVERKSVFENLEFEGRQIVGYFNSDLSLPSIARHGNLIGAMLHGPLLAKNEWLADEIIKGFGVSIPLTDQNFELVTSLADAAKQLETELAGQ